MPWIRRILPEDIGTDTPGARKLWDIFTTHAKRVSYSCVMSEFVDAFRWEEAENYRCYIDKGVPQQHSEGCIVNAYAKANASDEVITQAVAKVLRQSHHCSDAQFADWINSGSRWQQAYGHTPGAQHHPHTLAEIFGDPVSVAA